jgi:hypothetical protein
LESVGCAWYSWLHSKTATNCYGNNRFTKLTSGTIGRPFKMLVSLLW